MSMNREGRQTRGDAATAEVVTYTGNKALQIEESLSFEKDAFNSTGVDFPAPSGKADRIGAMTRSGEIGLPGLSEPEAMRHFVRLSQKNYAIDMGPFPLGSCTMKHNRPGSFIPRLLRFGTPYCPCPPGKKEAKGPRNS